MSNQVEDSFTFLWPFQNIQTLKHQNCLENSADSSKKQPKTSAYFFSSWLFLRRLLFLCWLRIRLISALRMQLLLRFDTFWGRIHIVLAGQVLLTLALIAWSNSNHCHLVRGGGDSAPLFSLRGCSRGALWLVSGGLGGCRLRVLLTLHCLAHLVFVGRHSL